jgi:hypothetical protein
LLQGKTLFGRANFGHWDWPFDFDQDREPVARLIETFEI